MIRSALRIYKNYYLQVTLEECKYVVKEKKIPKYITDDVETISGEENCDKERSDEETYNEEQMSFLISVSLCVQNMTDLSLKWKRCTQRKYDA